MTSLTVLDADTIARARRTLARRDPRLARVMRAAGPCALAPQPDPYAALVRSVLHQQLAGAAAAAIEGRVRVLGRGRFPRPRAMLAIPEPTLRAAGLSRQKIASIRGVADAFVTRRLEARRLARMPDDEVVSTLTELRGIGEWTAHMLLLFCLGRPDVLPVGDYGVRKAAMLVYGLDELPKPRTLEQIAEPWRPFRSVASWYLWRALDEGAGGVDWEKI